MWNILPTKANAPRLQKSTWKVLVTADSSLQQCKVTSPLYSPISVLYLHPVKGGRNSHYVG